MSNQKKIKCVFALVAVQLLLSLSLSAADNINIRIATPGAFYPYNDNKFRDCGDDVCGIEIELFNHICNQEKVNCIWEIVPWAGAEGPMGPGGILYNLINSDQYDVVVSSLSTRVERRKKMLFSVPYYTANHIFIGPTHDPIVGSDDFTLNVDGVYGKFPANKNYNTSRPSGKLIIGTYFGSLSNELESLYQNSQFIEIDKSATPSDLLNSKVDLFLAWNGIEALTKRLAEESNLAGTQREFQILGEVGSVTKDPKNAVGAAFKNTERGLKLCQLFSRGILKSRYKNGEPENSVHWKIFSSYLSYSLWAPKAGPFTFLGKDRNWCKLED